MNDSPPTKSVADRLRDLADSHKTTPEDYYGAQFWDYDDIALLKLAADALDGQSGEPLCTCGRNMPPDSGHFNGCPSWRPGRLRRLAPEPVAVREFQPAQISEVMVAQGADVPDCKLCGNGMFKHRLETRWICPAETKAGCPDGWCPVCGGQNGEHKTGCQDGSEIL